MSPRNPFAFLDSESPQRTLLLLLLAIIKKQGGEVTLSVEDLTSVEDGASFHKFPDDKGTSLVLRFARRGAEAFFLTEESSQTKTRSTVRSQAEPSTSQSNSPRHVIHDDIDLALREEEMAENARQLQQERLRQARAAAGAMPWRTRPQ